MVPGISFSDFLEATSPLHRLRQKVAEESATRTCCHVCASDEPDFTVRGLRDRGLYSAKVIDGAVRAVIYKSWLDNSFNGALLNHDPENPFSAGIATETRLSKGTAKSLVEFTRRVLPAEELEGRPYLKKKNLRHGFEHIVTMNDGHTNDTEYLVLFGKLSLADPQFFDNDKGMQLLPYVVEFICAIGDTFHKVDDYLESLEEDADAPSTDEADSTAPVDAPADADSDSTADDESTPQDETCTKEVPDLLTLLRELRDKEPTEAIKGIKTLLSSLPPLPTVKVSVSKVSVDSSEVNFDATARVVSALDELAVLAKDVDPLLIAEDLLTILRSLERLRMSRQER